MWTTGVLTSAVCCALFLFSGTADAQLVLRDIDLRPRAEALATVTIPYEIPANGAPVMLSPAAVTGFPNVNSGNANAPANSASASASHTGLKVATGAPLSSSATGSPSSSNTAAAAASAAAAAAAKQQKLATSTSSPSHSIPSGAIAGIVVGAALLFTSIALLAFCLGRRHRKSTRRNTTYDPQGGKDNRSSSFGSSSSTSRKWYAPWKQKSSNLKSRISHPSSQRARSLQGGELWGGSAVAEMGATRGDGHYVGPMSELEGTFEAVELPAGIVRGDERIRSGGSYGRHELRGEKGSYDRSELRAVRRSDGSVEAVEMSKGWRVVNE